MIGKAKPKPRCPRCRSVRLERRLDGSRTCHRCGQRVHADGRLVPSADRREGAPAMENRQLNLI